MQWRQKQLLLEDRIAAEKARLEEQAALLPASLLNDQLLGKIEQLKIASGINAWISSGLQPPK
jgi:hypothetical protein